MVSGSGEEPKNDAGFLVKFSSSGELLYGSYYDGEKEDQIVSIEVSATSVYVCGRTKSSNYMATPNSFQSTILGTSENRQAFF
ncbi:hypothetical protein KO504_04575 [Winogradskyella psychrotolerans]|nr:hypothetical protein [Winogradskyella psychrotolerans]